MLPIRRGLSHACTIVALAWLGACDYTPTSAGTQPPQSQGPAAASASPTDNATPTNASTTASAATPPQPGPDKGKSFSDVYAERSRDTETELEKKLKKAAKYPVLDLRDPRLESVGNILAEADSSEPKLVRVVARVLAIKQAEGQTHVSLGTVAKGSNDDCREHGKVTGRDPKTGEVRREHMKCVKVERKTTRRFSVTFGDWPSEIKQGMVVEFYGDLESVQFKGKARDSQIDVRLTGRYVGCFGGEGPSQLDESTEDSFTIRKLPECLNR